MSEPKDHPDTPATVVQWLSDTDADDRPLPQPDMGKDATDAQT